jgi:parallel beta-helix repeat protein
MILRSGHDGVYLFNAPQNAIGGSNAGDGNTISNNGFSGVHLEGSGATGNTVQGNTITNQSAGYGVLLDNGATQNTIGGDGGAANTFQNNALGNIQVLQGGLPPSGDPTGGNTFGNNNTLAPGQALATAALRNHHHKVVHHTKKHAKKHGKHKAPQNPHPVGPLPYFRKQVHRHA